MAMRLLGAATTRYAVPPLTKRMHPRTPHTYLRR